MKDYSQAIVHLDYVECGVYQIDPLIDWLAQCDTQTLEICSSFRETPNGLRSLLQSLPALSSLALLAETPPVLASNLPPSLKHLKVVCTVDSLVDCSNLLLMEKLEIHKNTISGNMLHMRHLTRLTLNECTVTSPLRLGEAIKSVTIEDSTVPTVLFDCATTLKQLCVHSSNITCMNRMPRVTKFLGLTGPQPYFNTLEFQPNSFSGKISLAELEDMDKVFAACGEVSEAELQLVGDCSLHNLPKSVKYLRLTRDWDDDRFTHFTVKLPSDAPTIKEIYIDNFTLVTSDGWSSPDTTVVFWSHYTDLTIHRTLDWVYEFHMKFNLQH